MGGCVLYIFPGCGRVIMSHYFNAEENDAECPYGVAGGAFCQGFEYWTQSEECEEYQGGGFYCAGDIDEFAFLGGEIPEDVGEDGQEGSTEGNCRGGKTVSVDAYKRSDEYRQR